MFNKNICPNQTLATKILVASSLISIVLTSAITQATADVVKGTQCHADSPVGFCCPNDGRPSAIAPTAVELRLFPKSKIQNLIHNF